MIQDLLKNLYLLLILPSFLLIGCKEKTSEIVNPEALEQVNIKNPIGIFCGSDCSNCNYDVDICLKVLKSNLASICGQANEQDCYTTWVTHSKTCQYICRKPSPKLNTSARLVNLVTNS